MQHKLPVNYKNKAGYEILDSYSFPRRFLTLYAVACAEKAITYDKSPDERAIKAVALAKRFGAGEDIPQAELEAAASAAYSACTAASSVCAAGVASAASSAARAACSGSYLSPYAACSAALTAAYHSYIDLPGAHPAANVAARGKERDKCRKFLRDKLIKMIEEEYSEVELILMKVI